ncbi:hypothetical protein ACI2KT_18845 [Ensifer adhaerens]|jgi:hypothetical protein|uniref:hypothetical protein n=1 Tax=Ensifer adhaerens TaxID=106592 RepID=UPI002030581E|nr:hypothetical protein [Ensifer adhaerens]
MFGRISLAAGAAAGGLIVFLATQAVNAVWLLPRAKEEGRAEERAAARTRSMEIIKERSRTNAEVEALDDRGLCLELGGVFENGECR